MLGMIMRKDGGLLNLNFVIQVFLEGSTIHFQLGLDGDEVFDTFEDPRDAYRRMEQLRALIYKTLEKQGLDAWKMGH